MGLKSQSSFNHEAESRAVQMFESVRSHVSLWHRQVQVAEDLQFAVGPAHVSALDGQRLRSAGRRRLQIDLHAALRLLEEGTTCEEMSLSGLCL